MPQKPIELILMRQLSACLATPIFLVDAEGTMIFYNEPAEQVLGMRFEETGEMPADEWATRWTPTADDGTPLPADALPLMIAVAQRRPAHGTLRIHGSDGARRRIEIVAVPLVRPRAHVVGAAAIFWETA